MWRYMDCEVLARARWRGTCGGGCGWGGRFEDLGAALRCECQAGGGVEADGEGDVVAGDEAAAVG